MILYLGSERIWWKRRRLWVRAQERTSSVHFKRLKSTQDLFKLQITWKARPGLPWGLHSPGAQVWSSWAQAPLHTLPVCPWAGNGGATEGGRFPRPSASSFIKGDENRLHLRGLLWGLSAGNVTHTQWVPFSFITNHHHLHTNQQNQRRNPKGILNPEVANSLQSCTEHSRGGRLRKFMHSYPSWNEALSIYSLNIYSWGFLFSSGLNIS